MKSSSKIVLSAIAMAALSACGGGGGGDPDTPAVAKYSQSDLQIVAHNGVVATVSTGRTGRDVMLFLASLFEAYALDSGGSGTVGESFCNGGTATSNINKSAVRTGLAAGDQVTVTLAQCGIGQNTVDGKVILTAQNTLDTYAPANYTVAFQADMRALTLTVGESVRKHDGVLNIQATVAPGSGYSTTFGVPAGQAFSTVETTTSTNEQLALRYAAATTFTATGTVSPDTASRKLDGAVTANSGSPVQMIIVTPTALVGSTSSGFFVASSGVIKTLSLLSNISTTTTLSGNSATVSGDSDRNGSEDLVFNTSWSDLTN